MGVVYKLKQEVIDFIVEQKRVQPDLSCRKLSDVIKEKFQVEVSKSSINAIIKQANLSSPVGRRASFGKTQKFQIPQEKKAELFSHTPSALTDYKEPEAPKEYQDQKAETPTQPLLVVPEPEISNQKEDQATETQLTTPPEPPAVSFESPTESVSEPPSFKQEISPEESLSAPPEPQAPATEPEKPIELPQPPTPETEKPMQPQAPAIESEPPAETPPVIEEKPPEEKKTEKKEEKFQEKEAVIYDGAGCFFLKAVEWELSHSSILGSLLSQHSQYLGANINDISEILLYLHAFGIKTLEDITAYQGNGLWEINGVKGRIGYEILAKVTESISNLKNLSLTLSHEYTQLFSEVSYVKLTFADNSEICFDAQQRSVWLESDIPPHLSVPLNKALNYLSENFISNTQPVVLFHIPGYKNFSKSFYDMLMAFESPLEKPIVKTAICDGYKNDIAKFTTVPSKKRLFITGMWPWQEECQQFISEDNRRIKTFYSQSLNKEIYYSELKTRIGQQIIGQSVGLRVFLLRESGQDWPLMGLMTNIPEEKMSSDAILSTYLSRWPNLKEGYDDFVSKTEKPAYGAVATMPTYDRIPLIDGQGSGLLMGSNLWMNFQFLISALSLYCQKRFFPPHYETLDFSALKDRFYGLAGHIDRLPAATIVTLIFPPGYAYHQELAYAVRRLNESDIRDYGGIKLVLRLVKGRP